MKKILLLLLLLLPMKLNAIESYVVMDSDSNRVLYSKNLNDVHLIASTTKIMTALVAIENTDLTKIICASSEIKEVYGSMIYLEENECLPLYDLLVGLLLRSGNDSAMTIMKNTLGEETFIKEMNNLALKIGMKNTSFKNPHGLDDETKNTSTAYDLALLMSYATKNKIFMEISSLKEYKTQSNKKAYLWNNKNKLLGIYKYATGGKIGYTTKSGHVFVSSSTKAKENLVVVTIKDDNQFINHKNLYEQAYKEYDKYTLLNKLTFSLKNNYYKEYYLYIKEDLEVMLKKEEKSKVNLKIKLIKKKKVENYSKVGEISVYVDKEYIDKVNIYAKKKM